jgi:hypothetical protein
VVHNKKEEKRGPSGRLAHFFPSNITHHSTPSAQGAPRKKKDKSDVHLLQRLKKSSYLLFFIIYYLFLYRFLLTRFLGKLFRKKPSGLITKNLEVFPSVFFFPPSVVWFDYFNRVFGRFVTRGVQKRDKKIA